MNEKVMIFIDANNFRQTLNVFFGKENAYIDIAKLVPFLGGGRKIEKSYYYVNKFALDPKDIEKQNRFFAAIEAKVPNLHIKAFEMQKRKGTYGYQEKQVDNEITLDMALEISNYDTAILVSQDRDYVGTVQRIISLGKIVEVVIPIFGQGHHLRQVSSRQRIISVEQIRTFLSPPRKK
jgi:uncharacterized LabA/DUF88 family protein